MTALPAPVPPGWTPVVELAAAVGTSAPDMLRTLAQAGVLVLSRNSFDERGILVAAFSGFDVFYVAHGIRAVPVSHLKCGADDVTRVFAELSARELSY